MPTTNSWRTELLERFSAQHVLILGDLILDEYMSGDCSRISAEAPVAVVRVDGARCVLGGAANTAANVVALGGHATLIGLCGDDETGARLVHMAAAEKIEFRPVDDGRPTTRKTRIIGQHQQLLRFDREVTRSVRPEVEDQLFTRFLEALPRAGIVVLSDYAKGVLTERLCRLVITRAREAGREVVIDPRPEHGPFYQDCDFITPNWKEGLGLLGQHDTVLTEASIQQAGRALADRFHANVVFTLGALGIEFFGRSGEHFAMPTLAREVFDVSGAGDTVVAALAIARSAGADHAQAVTLANAAAGVVVGKLGTATVSRAELQSQLAPAARLLSRADLRREAERLRSEGKRIVTINGSFDLIHYGHIYILQEARKLGDVLIVGLNSDSSVRAYKGQTRPLIPEEERSRTLLALRCVDYVHIFNETAPMPFLEEVRPDIHVNGSEYGAECIEAETVKRNGGQVHVIQRLDGVSTSDIIARIVATQSSTLSSRGSASDR
jgi:D-beta-D-heptose 7-phosphate kinase / D-beta-D-heptose 1-phosphate adenosyltransferase